MVRSLYVNVCTVWRQRPPFMRFLHPGQLYCSPLPEDRWMIDFPPNKMNHEVDRRYPTHEPCGLFGCLVLKIPPSCPFFPHFFLSSPTSTAAFLTCLREIEGASRTDKQRHTIHTTHSQWHWPQPLSVCTEEKVLVLAYQKRTLISAHTCPRLVT